jgi:hypothetical protein
MVFSIALTARRGASQQNTLGDASQTHQTEFIASGDTRFLYLDGPKILTRHILDWGLGSTR